ncbi:hypothetical protein, partial [Roseovarius gaetbuli]|uniref:hypothetical protein n=1 Tax=Roseovarius gaetbuli TaxID=1356575 RepID=UPI001BB0D4E1
MALGSIKATFLLHERRARFQSGGSGLKAVMRHRRVMLRLKLALMSDSDVTAWLARTCGEGPESADSVEKQRVAVAESVVLNRARAPFLSGFARLLRCRKDLGQFAE